MNAMANLSAPLPPEAKSESAAGLTHFSFAGKVFKVAGARFAPFGPKLEPRFYVQLGNIDASMEIQALRAEFAITTDSPDDKLITMAVKGLRYVPDIRPGDVIPSEILDGLLAHSGPS